MTEILYCDRLLPRHVLPRLVVRGIPIVCVHAHLSWAPLHALSAYHMRCRAHWCAPVAPPYRNIRPPSVDHTLLQHSPQLQHRAQRSFVATNKAFVATQATQHAWEPCRDIERPCRDIELESSVTRASNCTSIPRPCRVHGLGTLLRYGRPCHDKNSLSRQRAQNG